MSNEIIQQLAKFKTQDLIEYLLLSFVCDNKIDFSEYDQYYGMVSTEAKLTTPFSRYFERNPSIAEEIYAKLEKELYEQELDNLEQYRQDNLGD